jgi:hypothetical protein
MLPYEPSPFTSEGKAYIELQQRCRELQAEIDGLRAAHEPCRDAEAILEAYDAVWIEDERLADLKRAPPPQALKAYRERFNAARAAVLAAMRPSPPPGAWQPIETAPKDGTLILTVVAGWQPGIFRWDEIGRWTPDPESFLNASDLGEWIDGNEYNPTHWMPLPTGPTKIAALDMSEQPMGDPHPVDLVKNGQCVYCGYRHGAHKAGCPRLGE